MSLPESIEDQGLKPILENMAFEAGDSNDTITVFTPGLDKLAWAYPSELDRRPWESIHLPAKDELLRDILNFEERGNVYQKHGIPWHRGYLLYGPPGTGKTSLVKALAGHRKCDLYIINLGDEGLTDGALRTLLERVSRSLATNWSKFGKGFRIFLLGLDALWVINGSGPAKDDADQVSLDRMLVPYLYSKVTDNYQYLVEDATSAFAAWKALKAHFEKSNMTNHFVARGELHAIMHDPSKEVAVYIRAIADAVATKLKAIGVTIDDTTHKDLCSPFRQDPYQPGLY
ncbi:hypothetical protein B0H10DRAFT_2236334 [Mycena sp. CBHHK59/15]|nr:hypothetical protein B0H10DRAFT_2236334 [Mycena sp. CBHHK59/15]